MESLILVPDPYFNEPAYERTRGTPSGDASSKRYNRRVFKDNFTCMIDTLTSPPPGFEEVVRRHFYAKKEEVLRLCEEHGTDKHLKELQGLLKNLDAPMEQD